MYPELFKIGQFTGHSINCHSCESCLTIDKSWNLTNQIVLDLRQKKNECHCEERIDEAIFFSNLNNEITSPDLRRDRDDRLDF